MEFKKEETEERAGVDERADALSKEKNDKRVTGKEKKSRTKLFVGLAFMIVAVVVGFFVIKAVSVKNEKVEVLVAKTDIAAGTVFTRENAPLMFDVRQINKDNEGSYILNDGTAVETIYGKRAGIAFAAGTVINPAYIHSTTSLDGNSYRSSSPRNLKEGQELVALPVPAIHKDVAYSVVKGDIIRFYGVRPAFMQRNGYKDFYIDSDGQVCPSDEAYTFIYDLLSAVEVYAVTDGTGSFLEGERKEVSPVCLILICSSEQAKQVIETTLGDDIYFSILCSGGTDVAEKYLAEQEETLERYKLCQQEMGEGVEKKPAIIKATDLELNGYAPAVNDTVCLRYISHGKETALGDGADAPVSMMTTNEMLLYVRISDVFAINDNTIKSTQIGAEGELWGLSVLLSEEQKAVVSSAIDAGSKIHVSAVLASEEELVIGYQYTDSRILVERFGGEIPSFEPFYPVTDVPEENDNALPSEATNASAETHSETDSPL